MRPGARSSSARAGRPAGWSAASAGCCSGAGPTWTATERQTLRELFALNRRLAKAYLLKEQLAQLWTYTYEGAARRFLTTWLRALRWQRLPAFQKLGRLLTRHLEGLLNYCHEKVPFGTSRRSTATSARCSGGAGATGITSTYSSRSSAPPPPVARQAA